MINALREINRLGTNWVPSPLPPGAEATVGAAVVKWGAFVQSIVDFVIVAFVIFMIVRAMNRIQKPAPVAAPTTKECPYCFSTIPLRATRCPNCTSAL